MKKKNYFLHANIWHPSFNYNIECKHVRHHNGKVWQIEKYVDK